MAAGRSEAGEAGAASYLCRIPARREQHLVAAVSVPVSHLAEGAIGCISGVKGATIWYSSLAVSSLDNATVPSTTPRHESVIQQTLFACSRLTIEAIYKASPTAPPSLEGLSLSFPATCTLPSGARTAPP